jgi:hypothetical protein
MLSVLFGIGFSGVMTSVWVCIRELARGLPAAQPAA